MVNAISELPKMMNNSISTKLHFPARLYQVIEIEDPSVIAWELNGNSFRIVDSKRFRAETIPKYFRHGNMASIQRQLNLYGFRCTNRIDEKGVFHHPDFIRGEYDKVRNIRRKKTWPTKRKPKVEAEAPKSSIVQPSPVVRTLPSVISRNVAVTTAAAAGLNATRLALPAESSAPALAMSHDTYRDIQSLCALQLPSASCMLVDQDCLSPLSQLLASDDFLGLDIFGTKTSGIPMETTMVTDSEEIDADLLNLFVNDDFPDELD